ncbi:MAG: TonB-dependent siderophore receptor [Gammaproteobacteria bacterium]
MRHPLPLLALLLGLSPGSGAAPADTPKRLDEILVIGAPYGYRAPTSQSATRTPTPVEEIPQSISIITGKLLEDQQPTSIAEALRNVSGIVTSNTRLTPAFDNTRIRGFAAEQFVDGFTQYYNPGDRDSLVNVERIEVLKGTNGLLYGGGSGSPVGGVINIVSKSPRQEPGASLGVKAGSNSFWQGSVDINQPASEKVLFRITGEYTTSGSDVDVVENTRYNLTPALLLTNTTDTALTIRVRTSHWEGQDYQGLSAAGTVFGEVKIDPHLFIGPQDIADSQSDFDGLEARLDHEFNATWSGSLQGRIASSSFEEIAQLVSGEGFDFGADLPVVGPPAVAESLGLGQLPFALFNAHLYQEQDETSLVANSIATFNRGRTRNTLLLGADHSRYEDQGFINAALIGSDPFVDLANPVWATPFADPGPGVIDNFVTNTVYGAYVQLQTSIDERLHLLGGIRRGTVEIDYTGPGNQDETEETRWIPRVGAVYDITNGLSVFAGYSKGMRGQPFADFVTTPEPERSNQAEVGLKFSFRDVLTGQLAAFTIERTNVAVPTPNPEEDGGFGSVPEGEQSSEGVELELVWQPLPQLSLLGSYSYIETSYDDDLFAFVEQGGQALPGVPRNSGRLWANYDFESGPLPGLRVGAGVYAQDETLISLRNAFYSDSYFTIDASASYAFASVVVDLAIKNLSDEEYFERLNYLGGRVTPAANRAVYLGLSASF